MRAVYHLPSKNNVMDHPGGRNGRAGGRADLNRPNVWPFGSCVQADSEIQVNLTRLTDGMSELGEACRIGGNMPMGEELRGSSHL